MEGVNKQNNLLLREAVTEDARFLYNLRNDEVVRRCSFNTEEIAYEQHIKWFEQKQKDSDSHIFILEQNGEKIGQVRIDILERKVEISYALCENVRGNGYSKWMLTEVEKWICQRFTEVELYAEVKKENIASQKVFLALGYFETETEYGYCYTKKIPMFSVLMCTYNSKETLEHSISSVQNQRFPSWELIILDNGSSDGTRQLLEYHQKSDARIRCIYREDNVGWCMGISICLKEARGNYMMFLGADDYLATEETFCEVSQEIYRHNPDIIWTGNGFAKMQNGEYKLTACTLPEYKVYQDCNKAGMIMEIMRSIYYNSMMHYVKIEFLRDHGIDFYQPFYGDCQGMTEAMCKAEKMVVMSQMEYVLTTNTSKTSNGTIFEYDMERQWKSICEALPEEDRGKEEMEYIARRILTNLSEMCVNIVVGGEVRDKKMTPIDVGVQERFDKAEKWISSDAFAQMMDYSDREQFEEKLIGAAGVLYWACKKRSFAVEEIREKSKWLATFLEAIMELDQTGNIAWKNRIGKKEADQIVKVLNSVNNPHKIGITLVLRTSLQYDDINDRNQIQQIWEYYKRGLKSE